MTKLSSFEFEHMCSLNILLRWPWGKKVETIDRGNKKSSARSSSFDLMIASDDACALPLLKLLS